MTVVRGFIITAASGVVGGLLGTGIGYLLGRFAPDYYRAVFRLPPSADLDPIQAGVGLGLTQGLGAGLVVGLGIVLVVAWYRSRAATQKTK
jgi:hypothetical protein